MPDSAFPQLTPLHQERALAALHEMTTPESVGELEVETIDSDGIATLQYACIMDGYPGWRWNVSLATLPGEEPTVLEAELLPAEGALLAPEWVPWSVRLAEFLEAQKQAAAAGLALEEEIPESLIELSEGSLEGVNFDDDLDTLDDDTSDDDSDDDDDDDDDDDELDDDSDDDDDDDDDEDDDEVSVKSLIHSGDIDGVDIDDLDESASTEN
jgi:Protein of unknown function (DUF3027)